MRSIRLILLLLPAVLRAQWSRTDGPAGGAITRIGGDDRTMIASVGTMFYRSDDHGERWTQTARIPARNADDIVALPGVLLVGAHNVVLRSTDRGESWSPVLSGDSLGAVALTVSPRGYLFARSAGGSLWASEDRGESWVWLTERFNGVTAGRLVDFHAVLFLPVPGVGLLRSFDDGVVWERVASAPSNRPSVVHAFGERLYLATETEGVFLSDDDGESWSAASEGLAAHAFVTEMIVAGDELFALDNGGGVFQWSEGIWTRIESPGRPEKLAEDDGDLLVADRFDGLYRRSGTTGWRRIDNGIHSHYSVIDIAGSSSAIRAAVHNGLLESSDGLAWKRPETPLGRPGAVTALVEHRGRLYAGVNRGVLFSSDAGRSWKPLGGDIATARAITGFLADGERLFAASYDGLFVIEGEAGVRKTEAPEAIASLIDYDGALYAGIDGGGVYRSTDGGDRWSAINSGLGSFDINRLATIGPHLFASSLRESWRWDPAGERWEPYRFGAGRSGGFIDLVALPGIAGGAVAAIGVIDSATGVFDRTLVATHDSGESWKSVTDAASEPLDFMTLHLAPPYLLGGTMETGIWKIAIGDLMRIAEIEKPMPAGSTLRIAPNPSPGRTRLLLTTASPGVTRVEIFDLLGRPVDLLHDGYLGAGDHRFTIDRLDAGYYLVRAGEIVERLVVGE